MAANRFLTYLGRLLAVCITVAGLMASEHHGVITSGGLPVPGATITATNGDKKLVTTTDDQGMYSFSNLPDGVWNLEVEMLGFAKLTKEVGVSADAPSPMFELKPASMSDILASLAPKPAAAAPAAAPGATPATPAATPATTAANTPAPSTPAAGADKPSITQAAAAQQRNQARNNQGGRANQGGRGTTAGRGGTQAGGFQRLDVNQSGDLAAAGTEGQISNDMAADLNQSANDSMLVSGSVSRGLDMPQQPDWFGGRGGDGMGFGPGMGMPGMGGDGNGALGDAGGRGGPGGGGPGGGGRGAGGPGGGGPGGFGGGRGGPGGPGGFMGGRGAGGPGGRGGRGQGPGGRAGVASFGNGRRDRRMQYNGNVAFVLDNSVWDAQTYSVTGNQVAKPAYANARVTTTLGGPLKIPHLLSGQKGTFTINYQLTRSRNGVTNTSTVPTALERTGDFSQSFTTQPVAIYDPTTGNPFPNNVIPQNRINSTSLGLAKFYPLPNFVGSNRNYSVGLVGIGNGDNVNSRLNQTLSKKDRINGGIGYQGRDNTNPSIFGFLDSTTMRGINANAAWNHNFSTHLISNLNYRFSRARTLSSPFFSNKENVEQELGIGGASTLPINWGPPNLQFTQGISGLSDAAATLSRNQTSSVGESLIWIHGLHNFTFGGDYRRQQINPLSDSNGRGTFAFTGNLTSQIVNGVAVPGTGFDFADFLLGKPATSSVNFGNADKYFRTSNYDIYMTDDWRMSTKFTLNAGIRWDYQTPISELFNRLVNLDIASGYSAIAPVLPGQTGSLTGLSYPDSLVKPDRNNFSPRVGFAWRPFTKHSTRINGGYGMYYNTAAYTTIANNLAAQPPFAQNFSVAATPTNPLSINVFSPGLNTILNTRAIDPFYRIGYAQIWQLSVQNDLGHSLVGTLTLNHTKGTGLDQQFLPNSLPPGSKLVSPYPAGYIYEQSNGNSNFSSVQVGVTRRARNGISGSVSYMLSKAIDDGGIGTLVAQNWQNLAAERGLSSFDARHTMNANWQYSTGVGNRGGALMNGWKAAVLKGWNFSQGITLRSGSPLTALAGGNKSVVGGTGVSGPVRADATGLALDLSVPGYGFNPAAFASPVNGQWGTAGRDTIPGPVIFSLNASVGRNFRIGERRGIDFRFDATNMLNHVTITNWGTTLSSSTFGLPTAASQMRKMNATLRFRF